jgi:hypothetical protein
MPIDILAGSPKLREQTERQMPLRDIAESWREGGAAFDEIRRRHLLY